MHLAFLDVLLTVVPERRRLSETKTRHQTIAMIEVRRSLYPHSSTTSAPAIGIRKATAWYDDHIRVTRPPVRGQPPPTLPAVVLMTEDADNRQKAEKSGLSCTSGVFRTRFQFASSTYIAYSPSIRSGNEGSGSAFGFACGRGIRRNRTD